MIGRGEMRIFIDGVLWARSTGKTLEIDAVNKFHLDQELMVAGSGMVILMSSDGFSWIPD